MIGIYKITSPSNKIYVGQSIEIKKRWKRDYFTLNCKTQTKLYNSLKKYTPHNHKFEVIEECKTEELLERETYWKIKYRVLETPSLCCRLDGKGGKLSEETKLKISKSNRGISRNRGISKSKEQKSKMSDAVKNRIYTPERLSKMKNSMKGKNTRDIICINTGQMFNSIRQCAEKMGYKERTISAILLGNNKKTRRGHTFSYLT
jgi:group I intron endonuclease